MNFSRLSPKKQKNYLFRFYHFVMSLVNNNQATFPTEMFSKKSTVFMFFSSYDNGPVIFIVFRLVNVT